MESVLVDAVVGKLVEMMVEEINKECSLVLNFRKDFEWLSNKLTKIRGYLTDADAQSAHNSSVKSWLLDVAEDILDECAVQSTGNKCSQSSCVCAFSCCQLVFRYKMARRIKEVKDRMRSIMEEGAELKLIGDVTHNSDQPSTSTSGNVKWRGTPIIESGSHPVAIDSKVAEVLRLLDDSAAPVIAVVGMGGVGKTFLMQNVFNRVKDKFEKSIWLTISQTYSLKKLQAALAMELKLDEVVNERVDEVKAAELIHGLLESTRFLIVLDDVWRATGEDNLISSLGLPAGHNTHCKIVVTTRIRHVCSNMNALVYELQPLSQEESWNLFCAFAFQGNQPPHHLEEIARQVEGQCGKLPLAVKTVAASLADNKLSRDWEYKLEQLKAASYTQDPIMQILKLSYDSLPAHLKPCFVYLSFFPEDKEIYYQYLINLWVAEGYVPQGEDQLDIGWSYICHLHSLCLVERAYEEVEQRYDQSERWFKLHDLLLDLAISIAKESQCAFSVEEAFKKGVTVQTGRRYRRILMGKRSIGDDDVELMARNRAYSTSCLRTISFSANWSIGNIPAILLNGARVLRVLDLSGTRISSLPACVGNLKHLRVLNLRRTNITEVPECLKSNKSLRFLDISYCGSLRQFPEWIGELNCLEHLDIRQSSQKFMPKGISNLVSLQVLKLDETNKLSVEDDEFLKLEHFVNLVNLREVLIKLKHEAELRSIENGILATLVKMRNLSILNYAGQHNLSPLSEKMLAMKDLEYLCLRRLEVPGWICGFSNLMQLELYKCHCVKYPALEMMPNLIKINLDENWNCKALPEGFGKPGGFPQLRYFRIYVFSALEELPELEDGAMPRLEILQVEYCFELKKVPCGLELLKSLKECSFEYSGVEHMFEEAREVWNKMKTNNCNVKIER